jgi:hypothetical protein
LNGQSPVSIPPADIDHLRRRSFRLEYATMAWMVAEAAVAITAGLIAASIALIGFGLDSVIELFSATIVIWQLRGEIAGRDRETRAVRLIGVTSSPGCPPDGGKHPRSGHPSPARAARPWPGSDRRRADREGNAVPCSGICLFVAFIQ